MKLEPPFVAGIECAGMVVEVGHEVTGLAVGNRVLATLGGGAFAADAVARLGRHQVHRIPDEMPFDEAACFDIAYGTAYVALVRRGGLAPGDLVLVTGAAGGCGSAAVQVARACGATVIGVAGGPEKCAFVRSLGAEIVFDHHVVDSLSRAVRDHTGDRGVDVAFDTVGSLDGREVMRCLAWGGRFLVVGFASGDVPLISANQTILKNIAVVGVTYGMDAQRDPTANATDMNELFALYRRGAVTPHISHRFPLADTAHALRVVEERQVVGKVVIEMPT
jgi:NADPH2:quinone reductase